MLETTGIPTSGDLAGKIPAEERLKKGPVAIVECFREIPCDPCYHSCPLGAFKEFEDLNDIPELDYSKCSGCGKCIASCPGLAIFIVDYTYNEKEGLVKLPYEFLPLPEKGTEVITLNRAGEEMGTGEVVRVQSPEKNDKTAIVWISVAKDKLMEVRNIRVRDIDG